MKTGASTITTPFTSEVGGFRYEYQTTSMSGSAPSYVSFSVFKGDMNVVRGNKRTQDNGFVFECVASVTDEERNTIYNQVSTDLPAVIELASNLTVG